MPTNICIVIYDCKGCGEQLRPLPGSCCVFCSYGSVPCPPVQQARDRCGFHYPLRLDSTAPCSDSGL